MRTVADFASLRATGLDPVQRRAFGTFTARIERSKPRPDPKPPARIGLAVIPKKPPSIERHRRKRRELRRTPVEAKNSRAKCDEHAVTGTKRKRSGPRGHLPRLVFTGARIKPVQLRSKRIAPIQHALARRPRRTLAITRPRIEHNVDPCHSNHAGGGGATLLRRGVAESRRPGRPGATEHRASRSAGCAQGRVPDAATSLPRRARTAPVIP